MPYKVRTYINGVGIDSTKICPRCGDDDIFFPAYRNQYDCSGLAQPNGPIDDSGLINPSGITRPTWNVNTYGPFRAAPSGLTRYHTKRFNEGTLLGYDQTTVYDDINAYEQYWGCNSCHFLFIYPILDRSDMPAGAALSNSDHIYAIPSGSQYT